MTGMPAAKFRLAGRGLLRPGMAADVVLFDPLAIKDNASFEAPRRSPDGIRLVLVNGVPAVEDGRLQGALAGGVIRP
jgi:N-acyl-D-amino-acid deacylase